MTNNTAKSTWESYIEGWNKHNVETILATVVDDFIYDECPMSMSKPLKGKEAFEDYLNRIFTAFPDLSIKITSFDTGQKSAWSESILRGTQTGKIGGLPPSKKQMTVKVACVFGVAEGKLVYEHLYWDRANTLRQFGKIASVIGLLKNPVWRPER